MKAPTNVYGPDGTLCRKGQDVPSGWFDDLPDLKAHLDRCERHVPASPSAEETPAVPKKAAAAPKKITAKATVGRRRGTSS